VAADAALGRGEGWCHGGGWEGGEAAGRHLHTMASAALTHHGVGVNSRILHHGSSINHGAVQLDWHHGSRMMVCRSIIDTLRSAHHPGRMR
jgi:hypothetical protein